MLAVRKKIGSRVPTLIARPAQKNFCVLLHLHQFHFTTHNSTQHAYVNYHNITMAKCGKFVNPSVR
jgi:hypothetical protein